MTCSICCSDENLLLPLKQLVPLSSVITNGRLVTVVLTESTTFATTTGPRERLNLDPHGDAFRAFEIKTNFK